MNFSFYYSVKDFLVSRNGKIFLAVCFTLGAVIWVGSDHKSGLSDTSIKDSDSSLQVDSSSSPTASEPIHQIDTNDSFEVFTPLNPKETKVETPIAKISEPPSVPRSEPTLSIPKDLPLVHEPLFKEEHSPLKEAPRIPAASTQVKLPSLEMGAVVHCQLIAPVLADQKDAPVIARLTRSLIREGITVIPKGSQLFGKVQSSKDGRVFLQSEWTIRNSAGKQMTISAFAREKGHDFSNNKLGLPDLQENQPKRPDTGGTILGNVVKGIAALGKDTVRTEFGEYIPGTTRNVIINGSTQVLDTLLPDTSTREKESEPSYFVPAGLEFTLVVSSPSKQKSDNTPSSENIDLLIEQMLRKRLGR